MNTDEWFTRFLGLALGLNFSYLWDQGENQGEGFTTSSKALPFHNSQNLTFWLRKPLFPSTDNRKRGVSAEKMEENDNHVMEKP